MKVLTEAFLYVISSCLLFSITSSSTVNFNAGAPCQTVLQYVETAYFLNVGEQLRGADENILLFFFDKSIQALLEVLKEEHSTTTMSEVCLRNRDLSRIKRYSSSASLKVSTKDISVSNDFGAVSGRSHDGPILLTNDFSTTHPTYSSSYSVNNYPTNIFDLTVRDTLSFTVYPEKNYRFNSEILESCFESMGVGSAASNIRQLRRYRKFLGKIFYLPKEDLGDESLTTHNNDRINEVWSEIESVLRSSKPDATLKSSIARLPRTVEVFYDPRETEVKAQFKEYTGRALLINGFELLCKVTVHVLKLHLANVPLSISLQPLQHVASHLFNAMRVYRTSGESVTVPNIYVPFYNGYYTTAIKEANVPEWANGITWEIVQTIYGKDLLVLLDFSNHGLLTYNVLHPSGAYVEVDLAAKLFDRLKLEMLESEVNWHRTAGKALEAQPVGYSFSKIISSDRLQNWMTSLMNVQLPWLPEFTQSAARPTTICDDQFVYYEPTDTSWVNVDQHYCCARICLDIDYVNAPGISSTDQCCSFCNGASCPTHEGTPIASILSIMISDYGWLDGDVATIVL